MDKQKDSGAPSFLFDGGDTVEEDDDIFDYDTNRPKGAFGSRSFRSSSYEDDSFSYGHKNFSSGSSYHSAESSRQRLGGYTSNANDRSFEKIDHVPGSSIYGPAGTGRPKARLSASARRKSPDKPFIAKASSTHRAAGIGGLTKGAPIAQSLEYKEGDRVSHVKYGTGTVRKIEKGARDFKVTVEFDDAGQKIMFAAFAKLKKL
jgi:DNA helicase-2/ATP-dependent DNA helicase PcrA